MLKYEYFFFRFFVEYVATYVCMYRHTSLLDLNQNHMNTISYSVLFSVWCYAKNKGMVPQCMALYLNGYIFMINMNSRGVWASYIQSYDNADSSRFSHTVKKSIVHRADLIASFTFTHKYH